MVYHYMLNKGEYIIWSLNRKSNILTWLQTKDLKDRPQFDYLIYHVRRHKPHMYEKLKMGDYIELSINTGLYIWYFLPLRISHFFFHL